MERLGAGSAMTTDLRFRFSRLTESHGSLQRDYAEAVKRVGALEGEAREKNAALLELEAKNAELEAAVAAAQLKAAEALAALEANASAAALARELEELREDHAAMAARIVDLERAACRDGDVARVVADACAAANAARDEAVAAAAGAGDAALARLRGDLDEAVGARVGAEAGLRSALAAGAAAEERRAAATRDADDERARAELAERKRARAESRADAAEHEIAAFADRLDEEKRKQGSLADRLRKTVQDADDKVASAIDRANADIDRAAKAEAFERERAGGLEEQIAALMAKIDDLGKLPRGPQFAAFVKVKEDNEGLKEKLSEHGIAHEPPEEPTSRFSKKEPSKPLPRRASNAARKPPGGRSAALEARRASSNHMQAMRVARRPIFLARSLTPTPPSQARRDVMSKVVRWSMGRGGQFPYSSSDSLVGTAPTPSLAKANLAALEL